MITLDNVKDQKISDLIGVVCNCWVEDEQYFVTLKDVYIRLYDGSVIFIPKGFEFDGSSTPKLIRGILPRYGPFLFAALIHDFIYREGYKADELGPKEGRSYCDQEMLIWSNHLNNRKLRNYHDNYVRYYGVRIGGRSSYKPYKDAIEKRKLEKSNQSKH